MEYLPLNKLHTQNPQQPQKDAEWNHLQNTGFVQDTNERDLRPYPEYFTATSTPGPAAKTRRPLHNFSINFPTTTKQTPQARPTS